VHGELDEVRQDCASCHGDGAYYHQPARNAEHVPCPRAANVSCVDCHMPLMVMTGGAYQLHSHAPGVVEPAESAKWGMPSSCNSGGCHAGVEVGELQAKFDRHYRAERAAAPHALGSGE
jgi:hypothetical protein